MVSSGFLLEWLRCPVCRRYEVLCDTFGVYFVLGFFRLAQLGGLFHYPLAHLLRCHQFEVFPLGVGHLHRAHLSHLAGKSLASLAPSCSTSLLRLIHGKYRARSRAACLQMHLPSDSTRSGTALPCERSRFLARSSANRNHQISAGKGSQHRIPVECRCWLGLLGGASCPQLRRTVSLKNRHTPRRGPVPRPGTPPQ